LIWRRIIPFAGWLWASNLLNNSIEIVDRYMLLTYSKVPLEVAQSYVGQYHSSRIVPTLLSSIAAMLGGILLPYLSRLWEAGKPEQAAQQQNLTLKLVGFVFVAGGILILACSQFFFQTVLQGRYNDGLAVFPLTMACYTWFSLYSVGQDYLWVAERGRYVSLSLAVGLVVIVILNFCLIPVWGLWGAVVAAACGNVLVLFILLLMNHLAGCRMDRGIWVIVSLPLLLLIQPATAALSLLLVLLLAIRTDWIFNQSEKDSGRQFTDTCLPQWLRNAVTQKTW
jgi:O-antigen/teichoic acid export membrane protein